VRRFPLLRWLLLTAYAGYRYLAAILAFVVGEFSSKSPFRLKKKRILLVYDFTGQGYTFGDLLHCHAGSLILCDMYGVDRVDFAFVVNRSSPTRPYSIFSQSVNSDNVFFIVSKILQVNLINDKLGSTLLFDNHGDLHRFIGRFKNNYLVWPSRWRIASKKFLGTFVFEELFFQFYKKNKRVPKFECPKYLNTWVENFFRDNVGASTPVTVNLRSNPAYDVHRNSDMDAWLGFFKFCEGRYPAKFIVICNADEFDVRFRECRNVVYSKDFQTDISHELALISNSAMHLGAGSGPVSMAMFGQKPYLIVNTDLHKNELLNKPGMIIDLDGNFQRVWFANEHQKFCKSKETFDMLASEFDSMWGNLRRSINI
jgi:hypothetical protein